ADATTAEVWRPLRGKLLAGGESPEPLLPDRVVVPLRPPGDAAGVARFERGGARRVVAAEAQRHHADAALVELGAGRKIFVGRRGVALGLGNQREVAKADALAVAGAVDDQAADAARGEIGHRIAVLNLLGDVEAVEIDHGA